MVYAICLIREIRECRCSTNRKRMSHGNLVELVRPTDRHASLIPFREPPLSASDFWGPRLLDAHQPVAPVVATTTLSPLGREMWSLLPCQGVVIASGHCLFGATACQADTRCALERRRAARAAVSPFPPCVRLRKGHPERPPARITGAVGRSSSRRCDTAAGDRGSATRRGIHGCTG